jgi:hypothetical protein
VNPVDLVVERLRAHDDLERPFNAAPWPASRAKTSVELAKRYGGAAKVPMPNGGWNAAMSREEICRTWPGAHRGVVYEGEKPRWILKPHGERGCCTPGKVK